MAREDTKLRARRSAGLADQLFEPLNRLRGEVDRLFETLPARMPGFSYERSLILSQPAIEMTEKDGEYRVTVEVPGIDPKEIDVTVSEGMLRIFGEKKEEREEKEEGFMLSERSYGAFDRRIELPPGADAERIEAEARNGVLTITLPKNKGSEKAKRKIEIKSA